MKPKLPTITIEHLIDLNDINLFGKIPDNVTYIAVSANGNVYGYSQRPTECLNGWEYDPCRAEWIAHLGVDHYITNWRELCFEIKRPKPVTQAQVIEVIEKALMKEMLPLRAYQELGKLLDLIKQGGIA